MHPSILGFSSLSKIKSSTIASSLAIFTIFFISLTILVPPVVARSAPDGTLAGTGNGGGDGGDGAGGGAGGGLNNPFQGPSKATSCSFGTELAAVIETAVFGDDLSVRIAWSSSALLPAQAVVILEDDQNTVLASQVVTTFAGATQDYPFIGAFAAVPTTLQMQYLVRIEDLGSNEIAAPVDFRLTFDCSSGTCAYDAVFGLSAGSIAIHEDLMLALDTQQQGGSTDLLADVLIAEPQLEGQIWALALQMEALRIAGLIGAEPCECLWLPAYNLNPADSAYSDVSGPNSNNPTYNIVNSEGPGAAYALAAQLTNGLLSTPKPQADGETRLIMDLRCMDFSSWQLQDLEMQHRTLKIQVPTLDPCDDGSGCPSQIQHQVEAEGQLQAEAFSPDVFAARASAEANVDFDVDNIGLFSAYSTVAVLAPAVGYATDMTCTHKTADHTVSGPRSIATLDSDSKIDTLSAPEGYGFVASGLAYWQRSLGYAACAAIPQDWIYHSDRVGTDLDAGIIIQRWGDPRP